MNSRRAFLRSSALSIVALGGCAFASPLIRELIKSVPNSRKVLVCVFQRGAMDGLMAVQPFTDKYFAAARARLRMDMSPTSGLIQLDDRFALHPAFGSLKRSFDERRLAIIHGVGSPDNTRSHFDAQDYMENGTPGRKSSSGWLNRAAQAIQQKPTAFQCVAATPALPLSLSGTMPALAIDDLKNFHLAYGSQDSSSSLSFEALYARTNQENLRASGRDSFEASRVIEKLVQQPYRSAAGVVYPATSLGMHFQQVAQLIKADLGLRIVFIESNGWDTHVQQGTRNGQFARVASELSQCVSNFWEDLGRWQDDVSVLTMTEFGRTVRENGSGGTDHGRASCMFLLSNAVRGGSVIGKVPELAVENLEDGRDLPVTTDFRALFSNVARHHFQLQNPESLFPGWNGVELELMKMS